MKTKNSLRLIVCSDLHQWIPKWEELVQAVRKEKPRFVLIAGDLLPKLGGHESQQNFFSKLRRFCQEMKRQSPVTVLTYLGNDDSHILEPLLDQLAAEGLCINLNGRVHREEGLVFCGMNKVRDYPFGYKHWCATDEHYVTCPQQYCGEGLTVDEAGEFIPLKNLVAYLSTKPSLKKELENVKRHLSCGEMDRSIWMIHQPPSGLGMDICASGERVGSPTVLQFIADNQPLFCCSGHIHESPYQVGGNWIGRVGKTLWVQPGQIDAELHYVTVEITKKLSIKSIHHSIFGNAATIDRDLPVALPGNQIRGGGKLRRRSD
jgi:Icc-related predicted phosphoesterase